MSRYRRAHTAGATYFFTVVTYRRQAILCEAPVRQALRDAIVAVRDKRPFGIDAWPYSTFYRYAARSIYAPDWGR